MPNRNLAAVVSTLVFGTCMLTQAQNIGDQVNPPTTGDFYSMQNTNWPPLPWCPYDVPVYFLGTNDLGYASYAYDDREISYGRGGNYSQNSVDPPPIPGGDEGNGEDPGVPPGREAYDYGPNDLWIEIISATNSECLLAVHGTELGHYYQVQYRTNLNQLGWRPGEIIENLDGTNRMLFTAVPMLGRSRMFFRAQRSDNVLGLYPPSDAIAIEPKAATSDPGTTTGFTLNLSRVVSADTATYYALGGTAINGVDYTNLGGVAVIPNGSSVSNVTIQPIEDNIIEFEEPLTVALVPTNSYLVDPDHETGLFYINDNWGSNIFTIVATNLDLPVGMGYHPLSNALIVSVNSFTNEPYNFIRIDTNGIISPWSQIGGIGDEKKVAIVPETASGFVKGDLYFGTDVNGVIGRISADSSNWTNSWGILTTNQMGADTLLRGSLHIDRSGSFAGDLIAVTGGDSYTEGGEVWRINSSKQATRLVVITNSEKRHLEGVITLTNDSNRWGPWAGKIVTGAESAIPPAIYTVDTNNNVNALELGIEPEDFDIIETNQNLYCSTFINFGNGQIAKLSRSLLTNYWGDLLITQEGAQGQSPNPKLFIVHWDPTNSVFVTRRISYTFEFEHVTFAPINVPDIPGL